MKQVRLSSTDISDYFEQSAIYLKESSDFDKLKDMLKGHGFSYPFNIDTMKNRIDRGWHVVISITQKRTSIHARAYMPTNTTVDKLPGVLLRAMEYRSENAKHYKSCIANHPDNV